MPKEKIEKALSKAPEGVGYSPTVELKWLPAPGKKDGVVLAQKYVSIMVGDEPIWVAVPGKAPNLK